MGVRGDHARRTTEEESCNVSRLSCSSPRSCSRRRTDDRRCRPCGRAPGSRSDDRPRRRPAATKRPRPCRPSIAPGSSPSTRSARSHREIQAAAAETARVETALVASQGPRRAPAQLPLPCRGAALHRLGLEPARAEPRGAAVALRRLLHLDPGYRRQQDDAAPRPGLADPRARPALPRDGRGPADRVADLGQLRNNRTWTEAGKEFRTRMATAGYDVSLGDTWAMNEVPSSVRQNAGQSRRNLLDFLQGPLRG